MTLHLKTPFVFTLLLALLALLLLDKKSTKPARKPEPVMRPKSSFAHNKHSRHSDHVRPTRTIDMDLDQMNAKAAEAFNRGANRNG